MISLVFTPLVFCLSVFVVTCASGCKKLPNPVEIKDGQGWIPIADTAFLIPEKTWLKGYSRRSTDGMVSNISLHAMAPEVLPWSRTVHDQMYPPAGRGRNISIDLHMTEYPSTYHQRFPNFPQSIRGGGVLVEEPSDLAVHDLLKFRERSITDGRFREDKVYYEKVRDGKVKYFVDCLDYEDIFKQNSCNLHFPYEGKFEVTMTFQRIYMADSVQMADKVAQKLKEFEAAGQAKLAEKKLK